MSLKSRIGLLVSFSLMVSTCWGGEPQAAPGSPPPGQPRPGTAEPKAPAKITVADATPEEALSTFMLALLSQDETALRAVTLPNPDLNLLLNGQAAPPEVIKDATAQFSRRRMKRLKEGEKVALPRGKQYVVTADEVGENRAVLLPEGAALPTRLHRVAGRWKVAADPFIAARRAAEAAKKKATSKKSATSQKPASSN